MKTFLILEIPDVDNKNEMVYELNYKIKGDVSVVFRNAQLVHGVKCKNIMEFYNLSFEKVKRLIKKHNGDYFCKKQFYINFLKSHNQKRAHIITSNIYFNTQEDAQQFIINVLLPYEMFYAEDKK